MQYTLGETLRRLRTERGFTPEGLSAALGIPAERFCDWEAGRSEPSLAEARALSDAMGVTLDELSGTPLPRMNPHALGDDVSDAEKQRLFEEYEAASDARIIRGRMLVRAILIVEAVLTFLSFLQSPNLLSVVLSVVLIVFLWRGKPAARWIFIICSALSAGVNLTLIGPALRGAPWVALFALAIIAYRVTACVLMAANRSIRDFLYDQDTK